MECKKEVYFSIERFKKGLKQCFQISYSILYFSIERFKKGLKLLEGVLLWE